MSTSPSISRRQALKQTFFYSAALALAGRVPALRAEPAPAGVRHFLMVGDYGWQADGGQRQSGVAAAMKSYVAAQRIAADGVFLLGDNFYGAFDGGTDSPRWKTGFEDMYPAATFPGPCWAMLGNHDYDEEGGRKMVAELAYAKAQPGTRWTMPAKWYRVDWPAQDPLLTCLVLDSNYHNNVLSLTPDERAAQLKWLKAELAKPRTAPWLVCMAHHPLYSNGDHGDDQALIDDWGPLFQEHAVPFYLCGHDHDLQHLEFEGKNTSFVISGGGGGPLRHLKKPERGTFSKSTFGFSHLQISPEKFVVQHIGPELQLLHSFSRTPAGQVEMKV